MLGISIYIEKTNKEDNLNYIKLAHKYGFKRIFSCLLSVDKPKDEIKKDFKEILNYSTNLGMEVILDIAPSVFDKLGISYDDLTFFKELGATGIRLDEGFNGQKESNMTYNPQDLDIEINMSAGTKYVDNIISFQPNRKRLIGCHNFYPMEFSGLNIDHFIKTCNQYKKFNLRTAAFVTSQVGIHGPWAIMDGLCTLEIHRRLPIDTQVKHHLMMDLVDDIIIGNAFASEEELKSISKISNIINFDIVFKEKTTKIEKQIVLNESHFNRGDISDYLIRSTLPRIKFKEEDFPLHDFDKDILKGQITIGNNNFGQYKGELHLIKKNHPNIDSRKNIVAEVVEHERFLVDYLKPWKYFSFTEYKK